MKYGARRTPCGNGCTHASAKEARRCDELHLLQRAGLIVGLRVEPRFTFHINGREIVYPNGRRASYRPDFTYIENGRQVAEDVKGGKATITEASALRMALAKTVWPEIDWRVV